MTVRTGLKAAMAAALSLIIGASPVASLSQEAALPQAPVPYSQVAPKTPAAAPRPRPARAAPRPVVTPAVPAPTPTASLVAPGVAPLDPLQLEAYVDGVVGEAMANAKIAGVTVSVVQNGQVVLKKGYGYDRLSPARRVDPDRTLFRLASISKTFTWIAVMRQVETGRMKLDAPVNLYLPERVRVPDQGFDRQVRVIDLLTHQPGFEDRAFGHLFERDPARVRPLLTYLEQERPRREWEPGTRPAYSNYGTNLAGAAVAWQTQRPFESIIEQDITRPLGMWRTTFRDPYPPRQGLPAPMPAALAADVSEGYFWTGSGWRKRPYEYVSQAAPAGGASSTAGDMARYMIMLLNGGTLDGQTIFGPNTTRAFRQVAQRPMPGTGGFAHGFIEYRLPGNRIGYGHDGATLTFRSNMVIVPSLGLGVFVAVNTESGAGLTNTLTSRIVQRFYGGEGPIRPPVGSEWLKDNAGDFKGEYLSSRRAFHGAEKFIGMINGRSTVSVDDKGQLVIRGYSGSSLWTPISTDGRFRSTVSDRVLVFRMENGRAVGYYDSIGSTFASKVGPFGGQGLLLWLAFLTGVAAISTLIGAGLRLRLNLRQTTIQSRASLIQTIQSVLWLLAMACLALWANKAGDVEQIFFDWPSAWLVTASASALVAALLTIATVILLIFVWRGGRRLDSWSVGRKMRFTATVVIFALFSLVLATRGGLYPWAS